MASVRNQFAVTSVSCLALFFLVCFFKNVNGVSPSSVDTNLQSLTQNFTTTEFVNSQIDENIPASSSADIEAEGLEDAVDIIKETGPRSSLSPFLPTLLQYYLKKTSHEPVCVVFTEADTPVNDVGEKAAKLWSKLSTYEPFKHWQLGLYDTANGPLRGYPFPNSLPTLRCYVGTAEPVDYSGKASLKKLLNWFKELLRARRVLLLVKDLLLSTKISLSLYTFSTISTFLVLRKIQSQQYATRLTEADEARLQEAVSQGGKLTLLLFPGEAQHYQMEWMLLDFQATYKDSLQLFVVHPGSASESALKHRFSVRVEPTILVLKKGDKRLRVWQRFEEPLASRQHVEPFILAQTAGAVPLTVHNFQQEVFVKADAPILVCFYTHWSADTIRYLEKFVETSKAFWDHGARLRFGTVDVEAEKEIVPRWVNAPDIRGIPFGVLFVRDPAQNRGLRQIAYTHGLPTPNSIGRFLVDNNITLEARNGRLFHFDTWMITHNIELSMGESSIISPMCTAAVNISKEGMADLWSEGLPEIRNSAEADTQMEEIEQIETFTDRQTSKKMMQKPPQIGSISQVTDAMWFRVVEQSHAGLKAHELQQLIRAQTASGKRDDPKTNLVFFIQDGCGSCRRQQAMFERVASALEFIEGGAAYILNCTSDPLTCARLIVRGFSTLIAFRTFGQHSSERCLSPDHHQHTLRMDYHGLLEEKEILEWFSEVATPRVQMKTHQEIKADLEHSAVIVQATVYPQSLASQYLRSVGGADSWYPLDCFRVACERLYGRARCYVAYGENIRSADRHRTRAEEKLIVAKVEMLRQDGITSTIITSGRSLIASIQDEVDSQIHRFHAPHKYKLRSGQRCEDDHASCTDLITSFVDDHSRLPVTHITMTSFHAFSSVGFDSKHQGSVFRSGLPVLIALAHKHDMEDGAAFKQAMMSAAYDLYQDLVFTWVDIEEFPRWVARFVPYYYQKLILEHEEEITDEQVPSLLVYPRLCIVRPEDHRHAAFFPSANGFTLTPKSIGRTIAADDILEFAHAFLENPDGEMMETEHF